MNETKVPSLRSKYPYEKAKERQPLVFILISSEYVGLNKQTSFLNAIEQQYKERKLYKGFNLYLTDISLKPYLNVHYL